jgi:crossover junction endodeoxyribonuclease RuvC
LIILGIDPGLATTGFGLIEAKGNKFIPIRYGIIKTTASETLANRLTILRDSLKNIIREHTPEAISIEELFFNKNVSSAMAVGHARGVVLLTAADHCSNIGSYTPLQIKSSVCGYGKAEKKQVQYMVQKLLNLDKIPRPVDAADALAIAICHSFHQAIKFKT